MTSISFVIAIVLVAPKVFNIAEAATTVTFEVTDNPGNWFDCTGSPGCVPESIAGTGEKSLALLSQGDTVKFKSHGQANTLHTAVSLIWPTGAAAMPFDADLTVPSDFLHPVEFSVTLTTPGLYVFYCDIHPYMFAAVIVDDPSTSGLDLGKTIDLINGITGLPTASDLALRLVRTFFIATNPSNWQFYSKTTSVSWNPTYPPVGVLVFDKDGNPVSVSDLNAALHGYFHEPKTLAQAIPPSTAGVGEVWVDAQFEKTANKSKPGTATAVDATSWQVTRKVALPSINMNNPHNMWTDRHQTLIYQTQWFDNKLTVFDRQTGQMVRNMVVGQAPAHVMTRVNTDQVHVSLNGEDAVLELAPLATYIQRRIPMQGPGEAPTHPHGHWMSADGNLMVTPNADTDDSTLYNFPQRRIEAKSHTGAFPIATGMMPDSSKYYVSNFLDSTLSVLNINLPGKAPGEKIKDINLLANYNPITGPIGGPVGALPIQTPVSPDGKYLLNANTLTANIIIVDTATDTVVASLPCDAGCHGIQFGAKQGGGYYAYVASKFSNELIVVDPDPNNDGNPSDAKIVGRVLLTTDNASAGFKMDDTAVTDYAGMGGQGVLPIPVVYNGWVQNLPHEWKVKLTKEQQDPQ
ncbi:MAG: copper oxidase [candidate division NC10 bacterium]|nr:copper oxidase [candidate division NC10 bacterium]MDE2321732.1 copper oxidase [candidate division NC10 bacterium]